MNTLRLLVPVAALWCATAHASQSIDKSVQLNTTGTLEVSIVEGSLRVRGSSRDTVHISGSIDDDAKLVMSGGGDRVSVRVELPRRTFGGTASSDLTIELPAKAKLVTTTVSANTEVRGVQGAQQLQTVSGDIVTELASEDLNARTVSGSVRAKGNGSSAHVGLSSVSGDIDLSNAGGYVDATSVSGDLLLRLRGIQGSRLRTTSGDIEVSGSLQGDARINVESTSGNVRFDLGGKRDAQYDLTSFSGDIGACFSEVEVNRNKFGPGASLRFTEGKGSARLSVNTMSGDIRLCD